MIDRAFALLLMHHRSPIDWAVTRTNFALELYDPSMQSFRQFLNILEHYRTQISATDAPITNIELWNKILQALLSGDGV